MSDRTLQGWLTKKQSWLVKDTLALMMYNVDIAFLMPEVVLEKQILYMSAGLYCIITVYSVFFMNCFLGNIFSKKTIAKN